MHGGFGRPTSLDHSRPDLGCREGRVLARPDRRVRQIVLRRRKGSSVAAARAARIASATARS